MAGSIDLTNLLPSRNRDKTLDSLIKNLFNRHLSKDDFVPLFGYVGDRSLLKANEIQITEHDLEHQVNQLSPIIIAEHASERVMYSWNDLVQKMTLLGIDYSTISKWLSTKSYNFVPPIDLDKFCNFHEYFWIGNWFLKDSALQINGFLAASLVINSFAGWDNSLIKPEYYVIERSLTDASSVGIPPIPNLTSWSDWSISNLWIHKDDAITILNSYGKGTIGFEDLVQATRPIIEYHSTCRLNTYQDTEGNPAENGVYREQRKSKKNQLPLFDLYLHDGSHAKVTSAIFYYSEDQQYNIDPVIERRLVTDVNNDFIFSHSLVDQTTGSLYFYKKYDQFDFSSGNPLPATTFNLLTIWRSGPNIAPSYSKYDISGSLINQDKFTNYKNYFWIGCDLPPDQLPTFNVNGLPEYSVIEAGGTSAWSRYNYWKHVSTLNQSDLKRYVHATRPIIEFNVSLESQLISQKISYSQLPQFKHFIKNQLTGEYNDISSAVDKNLNDAYLTGHLLARVRDLEYSSVILGSSDIISNCFIFEGEYYLQGLVNGAYRASNNGNLYGYKAKELSYVGTGNGSLLIFNVDFNSYPEILSFTFNVNTGKFDVSGSVSQAQPALTPNVSYSVDGVSLQIDQGTISFNDGDKFIVEISGYVYERENLYVNVNGIYRTISTPVEITTEVQNLTLVNADVNLNDGVWVVPPQLEWNVMNETRSEIKQGDLYYHFISIIEAQPGLIGSSGGSNSWRNLPTINVGLGGLIKQFDGDLAIFISLLIQEGVTVPTLLEFARESYSGLSSSIRLFVENQVPQLLTDLAFTSPVGDEISTNLVSEFKKFFSARSSATNSIITSFYDSTSSIDNLVVTLPYLGLCNKFQPKKVYDYELNLWMLQHHDGHLTQLQTYSIDLAKQIVMMNFLRSSGISTPGIVSGFDFPLKPYSGQFWFKTSTGELLIYEALSDTGQKPTTAAPGSYSYDRVTDEILEFNGSEWISLGTDVSVTSLPWKVVHLDLIAQNLELELEKELYVNCPVLSSRVNASQLELDPRFDGLMASELEKFGIKYGATDVYASTYDASNPFTWNYSSVVAPGAHSAHAAWQEIYLDVYGTMRPDLEPWVSANYPTMQLFLADAIANGYVSAGTTFFTLDLWVNVGEFVRSCQIAAGKTSKLSVDVNTGALLPPYLSNSLETLFVVPPSSATNIFPYGTMGPIERFWKKTVDCLYSKQKLYFRLDPLAYVSLNWGVKQTTINEYTLDPYIGKKNSPSTISLHGDVLESLSQPTWISVNLLSAPLYDYTYKVTCVSRIDNIFAVSLNGSDPIFTSGLYQDNNVQLIMSMTLKGYFWGDTYYVTLHEDGTINTQFIPQSYYRAEGLNQLYVQYQRTYGYDSQVSLNGSLLKDWKLKLGYRFSGLINTDNLNITSHDVTVDNNAYNVYLKENKFQGSAWINALRIQLAVRGSTDLVNGYNVPKIGPNGTPGEDWVFRVDNFNEKRTSISWYEYDLSGNYQTFVALDGSRTLYSWKRYTDVVNTKTYNSPFLITGLQNTINFIFGYADKLATDGWMFNDPSDPNLDTSTGRPIDYQLITEQFIVQQFSNVDAGSSFTLNPFSRKVWFKTDHGTVSNLNDILGLEQESICMILDQNQKQITTNDIRVFRQDGLTELVFDIPAYTVHLLKSEYEHVILFEDYSINTLLIYDPFIGQKTTKVFFQGLKQTTFTGRLDFGGHYLINSGMRKNIESSIDNITQYYSTTSTSSEESLDRARALLGFDKKQYFKDRGTTDLTEFRFWQGMISNKGTNFSVNAYLNSKTFKTAKLDEFWAYKIAQYGDGNQIKKTEIKVEATECTTEKSAYRFIEGDESTRSSIFIEPLNINSMTEVDVKGDKLFSYSDLGQFSGFELKVIGNWNILPNRVGQSFEFKDLDGRPIRANCFEIVDMDWIPNGNLYDLQRYDLEILDSVSNHIYYEVGNYVQPKIQTVDNSPIWVTVNDGYDSIAYDDSLFAVKSEKIIQDPAPTFTPPEFTRLNHSTIRIDNEFLVGHDLKVIAYAPNFERYSPHSLFDYQQNVLVTDEIIWWDPARKMHHPQAVKSIDLDSDRDPAIYTESLSNQASDYVEKTKAWGESKVGTIWWNTKDLAWKPYSDSKINPDVHSRLSIWGSLSEASSIEVYEWVKSDVLPSAATVGDSVLGEPAVSYYVKRERTWWQRPVAWKYSSNPSLFNRTFLAQQPAILQIDVTSGYGTAVLASTDFSDYKISIGSKISGALYQSNSKLETELTSIFGLLIVKSDPKFVVGSMVNFIDGGSFTTSTNKTKVTVDPQIKRLRSEVLGEYKLTGELDSVDLLYTFTLTHTASGENQLVLISGEDVTLAFDKLGITITFDKINSSNAILNDSSFFIRSSVDIMMPISISGSLLTMNYQLGAADTEGWIAWNDPSSNPASDSPNPPHNLWEPLAGEWTLVEPFLADLAEDIKMNNKSSWSWFTGEDFSSYRSTWNNWKKLDRTFKESRFMGTATFFQDEFTFVDFTDLELLSRSHVYVNETKVSPSKFTFENKILSILFDLNLGDLVKVVIDPITPSAQDLEFDPLINDTDPYKLVQYKLDYPYVKEERRDENSNLNIINYYYWVKNKTVSGKSEKLSIKKITQLLTIHDGQYAIPEGLKFYDQFSGAPNRHAVLSISNLGYNVRQQSRYKLRITDDPTLRSSDREISKKNLHTEWGLIRINQVSKVSLKLWNFLTDTLAGETQLGYQLPLNSRVIYDELNGTSVKYGFGDGQILADSAIAIATVKHTILNTKIDKYLNGLLVPNYIQYPGFDISMLDTYLSSPKNIRKFMSDLWRQALPAQVNEIFFAVIEDAAAKNLEMSDFFKTSFISMNDIRTITVE